MRFVLPYQQALTAEGAPDVGATLAFYLTGTSTPATVYTDKDLTTAASSTDLTADSYGRFGDIFLDPAVTYKVTMTSSTGSVRFTADPVAGTLTSSLLVYPLTTVETAQGIAPTDYSYPAGDVRRYGADPNGVQDSSAAFQAAIDGQPNYGEVYVPSGSYIVGGLSCSNVGLRIFGPGRLVAKSGASMVTFSAAGCRYDIGEADLSDLNGAGELNSGVVLNAERCRVSGDFRGLTVDSTASSGSPGAVLVNADRCKVDIRCFDFVQNTGGGNGSWPRCVSVLASGSNAQIDLYGDSCVCGVVCGTVSRPRLGQIELRDMTDNGVYNLGATGLTCDSFYYDGGEEAWVELGTDTYVDSMRIVNQKVPFGIQNCTRFHIGSLTVHQDPTNHPAVIRTRADNTSSTGVYIDEMRGVTYSDIQVNFTTGTVNDVQIRNNHTTHRYTEASQQKKIVDHSAGDRVIYEGWTLRVVDDTAALTGSDRFTFTLPTVSKESVFADNIFHCEGAQAVRVTNFDQDLMHVRHLDSELSTGPYLREAGTQGPNKHIYGSSEPSVGSWKDGDIIELTPLLETAGADSRLKCVTTGDFAGTPPVFRSDSVTD